MRRSVDQPYSSGVTAVAYRLLTCRSIPSSPPREHRLSVSAVLTPSCLRLREVSILWDETTAGRIVDEVAWTGI